jgi:hypothetical protein
MRSCDDPGKLVLVKLTFPAPGQNMAKAELNVQVTLIEIAEFRDDPDLLGNLTGVAVSTSVFNAVGAPGVLESVSVTITFAGSIYPPLS